MTPGKLKLVEEGVMSPKRYVTSGRAVLFRYEDEITKEGGKPDFTLVFSRHSAIR